MAAIVLVLTAVLQLAVPSGSALPDRPKAVAAHPVEEANAAPVAPKTYPAVMAHPIFAPDRAPPPAEADNTSDLGSVEVLGTAIRGKDAAAALLRESDGTISRLKIGGDIDGWKLVSIAPTELTFDRNGERRSLTVDITAPKPAAGTATKMGKGANAGMSVTSSDSSDDSSDDDDE